MQENTPFLRAIPAHAGAMPWSRKDTSRIPVPKTLDAQALLGFAPDTGKRRTTPEKESITDGNAYWNDHEEENV